MFMVQQTIGKENIFGLKFAIYPIIATMLGALEVISTSLGGPQKDLQEEELLEA